MEPIADIDEALKTVKEYDGLPEEFQLPISDSINDSLGLNMAIITDAILKRGWLPNGFIHKEGFRIYLYEASK
jgi:hypothetical protein